MSVCLCDGVGVRCKMGTFCVRNTKNALSFGNAHAQTSVDDMLTCDAVFP